MVLTIPYHLATIWNQGDSSRMEATAPRQATQRRQFSVVLDEQVIEAVDLVARTLVPPTSRAKALGYLVDLGLAEYRRMKRAAIPEREAV